MKLWFISLLFVTFMQIINPFFTFSLIRNRYRRRLFIIPVQRSARSTIRRSPVLARGTREAVLAVNGFCDDTCAVQTQQDVVVNCMQRALNSNSKIIRVLRRCTGGADIPCSINVRGRLNRCLIRESINRRNVVSISLQRCFRNSLTLATIDCLVRRHRILRILLPLRRGPSGPVVGNFNRKAPKGKKKSFLRLSLTKTKVKNRNSKAKVKNSNTKAKVKKCKSKAKTKA